jgi:hypothetical protein
MIIKITLSRLALNLDPLDLCLLGSWNYRRDLLHSAFAIIFIISSSCIDRTGSLLLSHPPEYPMIRDGKTPLVRPCPVKG